MPERVSFFFPAGDFVEAVRRFRAGEAQSYATHNEVAKLLLDLAVDGHQVTAYSLVTAEASESHPADRLRIFSLGASRFDDSRIVEAYVQSGSDLAIVHFPHLGLLRASSRGPGRVLPILASSYNRSGIRPFLERRRLARLLSRPKFRWVANHCRPATEHLADLGIDRSRLIPWDVPHPRSPADYHPKSRAAGTSFRLAYAGAISENKGVGDIVRAVASLHARGEDVTCTLAGGGEIERFRALADKLGRGDRLSFLGMIGNDRVIDMFRSADAVIVPSRPIFSEGFPLTLFEAIATRTPIVCSDHPMFVPVLKDQQTAMVFQAGKPEELARKIAQLARDPDLYERLSRNADLSWTDLARTADWRTMILQWIRDDGSPYLAEKALNAA